MTQAHDMLDEFLANAEPATLDIPYSVFKEESFVDQHALRGAIQLAVLEGKITSSHLRDGGGYRLTRIKGAAHKPLPVSGYTPQSDAKVALVNEFKQDEERLLRKLDALARETRPGKVKRSNGWPESAFPPIEEDVAVPTYDQRWLAVARTHFQEGFSAMTRAVFQPQRVKLPEDDVEPIDAAEDEVKDAMQRSDFP